VGKGCSSYRTTTRKFQHLHTSSLKTKSLKNHKINSILNSFTKAVLKTYVIQINSDISEQEAFNNEIQLIQIIGRQDLNKGSLCNHTTGGDGTSGNIPKSKGKTYEELYGIEKAHELKQNQSIYSSGQNNSASKTNMSDEQRYIKGQKSIKTRMDNNQIRKGSECNFSKENMGEDAIKQKNLKSARTYKNNIVNGYQPKCRTKLPKYLAISPTGEQISFQGFQPFAKKYFLSEYLLKHRIDKGIITANSFHKKKTSFSSEYLNSFGWEIKSIN